MNSREDHPRMNDFVKAGINPNEPTDFSTFRDNGLLWLINTTVFHPRGFALAIHVDDNGTADGYQIIGDGSEEYRFDDSTDKFLAVKALFAKLERDRRDPAAG